ncbi:MAG: hypothetical protein P9X27_02865 [Candidatus Kaelpia aquatica]|nr:hypothetical protein [Candidatus Kaelpia aquatica]
MVKDQGFELISFSISQVREQLLLRIVINKIGGVTLDECVNVNRKLGNLLEEKEPFDMSYNLEVSSPGVDKVIESEKEYKCLIGRELIIKIEDNSLVTGVLKSIKGGVLIIGLGDKDINLNIVDIKEAKQKIKLLEA